MTILYSIAANAIQYVVVLPITILLLRGISSVKINKSIIIPSSIFTCVLTPFYLTFQNKSIFLLPWVMMGVVRLALYLAFIVYLAVGRLFFAVQIIGIILCTVKLECLNSISC